MFGREDYARPLSQPFTRPSSSTSVSACVVSAQVFAQHGRCPQISTFVLESISSLKVIVSRIPALSQISQVSLHHLDWPQIPSWVSRFLYPKKKQRTSRPNNLAARVSVRWSGFRKLQSDNKGRAGSMTRLFRQGQEI